MRGLSVRSAEIYNLSHFEAFQEMAWSEMTVFVTLRDSYRRYICKSNKDAESAS